ncbi:hypothetical protein K438DRAFT_2116319 [Mycena galopus ATCC 62051]|nr:hypothetical protein K438DRAFT_2116319 [Mycena galopus ATCC 62051]
MHAVCIMCAQNTPRHIITRGGPHVKLVFLSSLLSLEAFRANKQKMRSHNEHLIYIRYTVHVRGHRRCTELPPVIPASQLATRFDFEFAFELIHTPLTACLPSCRVAIRRMLPPHSNTATVGDPGSAAQNIIFAARPPIRAPTPIPRNYINAGEVPIAATVMIDHSGRTREALNRGGLTSVGTLCTLIPLPNRTSLPATSTHHHTYAHPTGPTKDSENPRPDRDRTGQLPTVDSDSRQEEY